MLLYNLFNGYSSCAHHLSIVLLFPVWDVKGKRITLLCEVVSPWGIILLWLEEVLGMMAVMCSSHLCSLDDC